MSYRVKPGKELRVAISGKSGCGNTTLSTMLSEALGIKLINYTFRQLAEEKGLTLAQVIENAKTDDFYDKYVDSHQVELAKKESCVLGSRLAIWMLKEADFKVYIKLDAETRAKRILNREGGDLEEIKKFTEMRDSEDSRRYKQLYNIDNSKYDFVDLEVDSSIDNPPKLVQEIIDKLIEKGLVEEY